MSAQNNKSVPDVPGTSTSAHQPTAQTQSATATASPMLSNTGNNANSALDQVTKGTSNKVKLGIGLGLALGAAAIGSFFLFKMMNRVKLTGTENIPLEHENVLYCLNHNSILDNFAFETAAYLPKVFFRPEYLPVNLADRKNFFGDPRSRRLKDRVLTILGKHFFRHLRAYPVDRRTGDLGQVDQWIEMLRHNIVVVFPEGTRSRTGEIGPGKPGVGKMIYQARPVVIPVRMTGMEEVLGVGRIFPRVFHTVEIIIGQPMQLTPFFEQPLPVDDRERLEFYRAIANAVLAAIKALKPETPKPLAK